MTTITVPVFIHARRAQSWETPNYGEYFLDAHGFSAAYINAKDRIDVIELSATFELPASFHPVPQEIAALEAKRAELLADTQVKINFINDTISKLQCLTLEAL